MAKSNLVTLSQPRSAAAEAYRSLRTNLMFSSVEDPIRTLLVTSAARDDQKSITLANLAVTFAQGGNKTILVDADLRQPKQHDIWGISNGRGLSGMMLDDSAISDAPVQASEVDNLRIVTAGDLPPNPADLLGGKRMDTIIAALKEQADYVLYSTVRQYWRRPTPRSWASNWMARCWQSAPGTRAGIIPRRRARPWSAYTCALWARC